MTENEEFEFRHRLEQEQQAAPQGLSPAIEADKVGLKDATVSDAFEAPMMIADAAGDMAAEKLGEAGHPVAGALTGAILQTAPYIPAVVSGVRAAPAIIESGMAKAGNIRNSLAAWFKQHSLDRGFEALGGTKKAALELGDEGANALAEFNMKNGVIKPYASAKEMRATAAPLHGASGAKIGALRQDGNAAHAAEDLDALLADIGGEKAALRDKYTDGMEAGSRAEFERAIRQVEKLRPSTPKTIQKPELMQTTGTQGELPLIDDAERLESSLIQGEKTVPQMSQIDGPAGQMDLLDRGFPELFPKGPTRGSLVPDTRTTPVAAQSRVPSLSGQQSLFPEAPVESSLKQIMTDVPNPAYPAAAPTTTDFANVATKMNRFAANEKSMLRPSGATADVANAISMKNDANLVQTLGADKGKQYADELGQFQKFEDTDMLLKGLQAGEKVGGGAVPMSKLGVISRGVNVVAPASARAHWYQKMSEMLRTNPAAFGRNGQTLQRAMKAGKASLASTIYMLQQQDPAFKAEFEEMNRQ